MPEMSPCIVTERIADSREFHTDVFDARVTFDCGCEHANARLPHRAAAAA